MNYSQEKFEVALWPQFTVVASIANSLQATTNLPRLRFLAGGSGLGKSSLVRLGVLPTLRQGHPVSETVCFTPHDAEAGFFASFVAALQRAEDSPEVAWRNFRAAQPNEAHVFVVIDDFEQVLLAEDLAIQVIRFLREIAQPGVTVLATLRSPFTQQCEKALAACALEPSAVLQRVEEFPQAELGRAVGVACEAIKDRCVSAPEFARIVSKALSRAPFALQFVPHFLEQLPEGEKAEAAWQKIGGLAGIISSHAEATLSQLKPRLRRSFEPLVENLVAWDEALQPSAKQAAYHDLTQMGEASQTLLDVLIHERILYVHGEEMESATVTFSHPNLLLSWPRLRKIIHAEQRRLEDQRAIEQQAHLWQTHERQEAYRHLRHDLLAQAETLLKTRGHCLPEHVQDFLGSFASEPARKRSVLQSAFGVLAANRLLFLGSVIALGLALHLAPRQPPEPLADTASEGEYAPRKQKPVKPVVQMGLPAR